jgi:hypothetical protein
MKAPIVIAIVFAALTVTTTTAGAADDLLSSKLRFRFQNRMLSESISPDGRIERDEGIDHALLRDYFHHAAADSLQGDYLAARFNRLYGIEQYEISPLQAVFESAEKGASLALFASALGTTFAGWDEDSTWYLMGAAAAAGALWGGVHADEPGWRVRYRWEP